MVNHNLTILVVVATANQLNKAINMVMNIHNRVRRNNNINYATATEGKYERQRRVTDA